MRIERLELSAFGKFTGETLEFGGSTAGLHVVYGDNEAGKSTALRAIRSLLFGVPQQSADTFVHAGKDIRLGAELSRVVLGSDGAPLGEVERLAFVRRKGRVNTLLSPTGEVLEEKELARFLGGVDQKLFDSMFGLNHETLRQGAQSLLALEGKLGATLFEAGFGTAHLRQLLQSLREQAEELFTARGRSKRLNVEIGNVRKAKELVASLATPPQTYLDLRSQLEETRTSLSEVSETRQELHRRKSDVEMRLRLLPLVAQWRSYQTQLTALGALPPLPLDAEQRAHSALRSKDAASAQLEQARRELGRVEQELAAIVVDERLLGLSVGRMDDLNARLGSARKAAADLPKRQAELSAVYDDVIRIARHLGYEPDRERVEEYRLTKDEETQVRRLIRERTQYDTKSSTLEGKIKEYDSSLQSLKRELTKTPDETNLRSLEMAHVRAQKHVDLELALDRAKLELDAADRKWAALVSELRPALAPQWNARESGAPPVFTCEELWADKQPVSADVVAEFVQQMDSLGRREEQFEAETFKIRERVVELSHAVKELEERAAIPTEEALAELRRGRDALIDALEAALTSASERSRRKTTEAEPAPKRPRERLCAELRQQVNACDEYAEKLLRASDRVAEHRARRRALAEALEQLELREQRHAELARERDVVTGRWETLWAGTAFVPSTPRQMPQVLARVNELRGVEHTRREVQAQVRKLERELATVVSELSTELIQAGEQGRYLWESLTQLVARLDAVLQNRRTNNVKRAELVQRIDLQRQQLEQTQRELAELREVNRTLRSEWPKVTKRLGLGRDAGPEELQAALDALADLFKKVEEARGLERRIAGIQRDADALRDDVYAVAALVYTDRPELGVIELLERLLDTHRKNLAAANERQRLGRELEQRREHLQQATLRQDAANHDLARLQQLAQVTDVEALLAVLERVTRARDLSRLRDEEERKIIAQGEGRGLQELVAWCEGQDSGALAAERTRIQEQLGAQDARWEELTKQRVGLEQRLSQLGEGAARAAEELEAEVATLQASVRRYLRLKVATTVLETEIERYRRTNQGPVLGRAREFFPKLTLGRYNGLTVGYDGNDEPVLLCTTADGRDVGVEGLSDGTRDQLYLSLRLATLLQYFETNAKLPWILDDVLVHFDDARAAAALGVLAEFSRETQVLFFTHHARTVDLARAKLPAELVAFHHLGAPTATVAAHPSVPSGK